MEDELARVRALPRKQPGPKGLGVGTSFLRHTQKEHMLTIVTDKTTLGDSCLVATPESCAEEMGLIREVVEWVKDDINHAVGLAAPQVGSKRAWFVMRNPSGSDWFEAANRGGPILVVANPKIKKKRGSKERRGEYCFSLPGEGYSVPRHTEIEVTCQLLDPASGILGQPQRMLFTGRSAQIFQHEHHHLFGVMICDVGEKINV